MEQKFKNATPLTVFIRFEQNIMINKMIIGKYKVKCFGDLPKNKNFKMKYEHRSQWENPKMCNILKTADRRAKRTKFGTRGTIVHTCRELLMPDSLSLVWGHSVHFAKFSDLMIFETLLFQQFLSDSNHTSHKVS